MPDPCPLRISDHSVDQAHRPRVLQLFNAFNYASPTVGSASVGCKDTVHKLGQTGQFAWNLVTRPLAEAMNQTCAAVPPASGAFVASGSGKIKILAH